MELSPSERLTQARELIDHFALRTGLSGVGGDLSERYLWTDAFAVRTCFALATATGEVGYHDLALRLIEAVHTVLGRHRPDDSRQGWLSGLPDLEGMLHPTIGGLRIGKKLPERRAGEPFDEQLEWERDGQYFHYLTRWCYALLQAQRETGDDRYALWAAELMTAAGKFVDSRAGSFRMFWKMSMDLSRPLVTSMGAHDPLDGLICTVSTMHAAPGKAAELRSLKRQLQEYCYGRNWSTTDSLGIGTLLLDAAHTSALARTQPDLPAAIRPEKLLTDGLQGLDFYRQLHNPRLAAEYRLPFRECGLALGLRVVLSLPELPSRDRLQPYAATADDIETFWADPAHQTASTWLDHRDINAVTLAASLIAPLHSQSFYAV